MLCPIASDRSASGLQVNPREFDPLQEQQRGSRANGDSPASSLTEQHLEGISFYFISSFMWINY